jgi:hypothetical protein
MAFVECLRGYVHVIEERGFAPITSGYSGGGEDDTAAREEDR